MKRIALYSLMALPLLLSLPSQASNTDPLGLAGQPAAVKLIVAALKGCIAQYIDESRTLHDISVNDRLGYWYL